MPDRPKKTQLPADEVREFRKALEAAFKTRDDYQPPRTWSAAKWGVYAFYDYDGEGPFARSVTVQLIGYEVVTTTFVKTPLDHPTKDPA